jgi:hypothetical protein
VEVGLLEEGLKDELGFLHGVYAPRLNIQGTIFFHKLHVCLQSIFPLVKI